MEKNFIQRLISGLVYILVIISCTHPMTSIILQELFQNSNIKQHYLYFGVIVLFFIISLWEGKKIMKFGNGYEKWVVFPFAILVFYMFSKKYFNHGFSSSSHFSELLSLSLIAIAITTLFKYSNELYYDSGKIIFLVIYTALPFGFALGLPRFSALENKFTLEVLYLFILIWSSDSFAYIAGRLFGKNKMAPKISPKKTWEGFAGGVLLTVVFSIFIEIQHPELRANWIIVGLLVAIFAPIGDLVESQFKRIFGVKDSGKIIPGHGGVLDRLDSFIICAPVVYLYFIIDRIL